MVLAKVSTRPPKDRALTAGVVSADQFGHRFEKAVG